MFSTILHFSSLKCIKLFFLVCFLLFLTVSPEGILSTIPTNVTVFRGDNITFTCQTDAGPNTQIFWLYNASDILCTTINCTDTLTSKSVPLFNAYYNYVKHH